MGDIVKFESVKDKIVQLRGQDVILDFAVAELYGVETREINQAVKNNPTKFPEGYILETDQEEANALRLKFLIKEDSSGRGKFSKYDYKAFTEKGLYMLATILNRYRNGDLAEFRGVEAAPYHQTEKIKNKII